MMLSCRKTYDPYKFEEAFNLMSKGVSCARISRIFELLSGTFRAWKEKGRSVDLIAIFHIFQWVSNILHISLKCTHVDQCQI